jgi:hypothetical protein
MTSGLMSETVSTTETTGISLSDPRSWHIARRKEKLKVARPHVVGG